MTVTLRTPRPRSTRQQGRARHLRRDKPFEGYFYGEYTSNDLPTAIQIGAEQTVRWIGLIVGGLGQPRRLGRRRPDRAAAGRRPGRHRDPDRRHLLEQRADPDRCTSPGILSANLAVVNILPFPPLDGGRMLMITLKRVFGARISLRAEQLTYIVGFVFLFAFIIWVTGFDIIRSLGGGVAPHDLARQRSGRAAGRPSASTSAACSSARPTRSSSSR